MKIKYVFDPGDFDGCGQMVVRNSFPVGCKDYSFGATVSYKVGYRFGEAGKGNDIYLISMADGMCIKHESKQALCDHLNNDISGFRPMTDDEITNIMLSQHNRFQ